MCIIKNECNVKLEIWVIMMCQCRFIDCNKCTPPVGDIDYGGSYVYLGSGGDAGNYKQLKRDEKAWEEG